MGGQISRAGILGFDCRMYNFNPIRSGNKKTLSHFKLRGFLNAINAGQITFIHIIGPADAVEGLPLPNGMVYAPGRQTAPQKSSEKHYNQCPYGHKSFRQFANPYQSGASFSKPG
jgi:hypothetical protein